MYTDIYVCVYICSYAYMSAYIHTNTPENPDSGYHVVCAVGDVGYFRSRTMICRYPWCPYICHVSWHTYE